MSKLVDKLRKISQGEVHHMGFGGSQPQASRIPALALMASIPSPDASAVEIAARGGVDALLVKMGDLEQDYGDLEKAVQIAGDVPCGVTMEAAFPEDIGRLLSAGADFLALHTEIAPCAVLRSEKIGRMVTIDPYLEDSLLRTLDRLPVDVVLVDLEQENEQFLTVREVMACRRAVDIVRKPFILRVASKLSGDDLVSIRDLGIEGILIDLGSAPADENLARLRKAIDELPPQRKPRERLEAILPRQTEGRKVAEPEDDEL